MNLGGFSLKRLFGISKSKRKVGKFLGVPWSKQGRRAKFSWWRW